MKGVISHRFLERCTESAARGFLEPIKGRAGAWSRLSHPHQRPEPAVP